MKRRRGTAAYATAAILAVTALAIVHLTARDRRVEATHLEFINVTAHTRNKLNPIPTDKSIVPTMTPTEENILSVQEVDSARNFGESARSIITTPKEDHLVLAEEEKELIAAPEHCEEKNCQEFLSEVEKGQLKVCEKRVRTRDHYMGPINNSDCKFLPNTTRHPVALISPQGAGNTWTRGLLEKATGICTGFIYCDTVMRARGYVGERIKSGKVLVVKTHSPVTKWRGGNNTQSEPADSSYAAAVFILRDPAKSVVAEWNRNSAEIVLGKHNYSIARERHTYSIPKELFGKFSR